MYKEKNAQGMQQISCYTAHSCAHIGYIGSVMPLPSRPAALGPKSLLSQNIPCGTRACVTTITYHYILMKYKFGNSHLSGFNL